MNQSARSQSRNPQQLTTLRGAALYIGALLGPGLLGGPFGAVHGTVVVPKSGGGYQTITFQNGKVTDTTTVEITGRFNQPR